MHLTLLKLVINLKGVFMIIEKVVLLTSGTMVLASTLLSVYHSPAWLYFTGFVGVNMIFSGLTGFCPLVKILRKFGLEHGLVFK